MPTDFQLTDRIVTRIQGLSLWTSGMKLHEVMKITGLTSKALYKIRQRAIDRGFNPTVNPKILAVYVQDSLRSGRPGISLEKYDNVIAKVTKDRFGREKSTRYIASELQISQQSLARILKKHGYQKVKPMWKPNLTPAMKAARLAFAVEYKDWTIEDWKRVIWTDETSVVLGQRRGSHRIWRTLLEGEKPVTSTVRERYHKATEFMFWASFS